MVVVPVCLAYLCLPARHGHFMEGMPENGDDFYVIHVQSLLRCVPTTVSSFPSVMVLPRLCAVRMSRKHGFHPSVTPTVPVMFSPHGNLTLIRCPLSKY